MIILILAIWWMFAISRHTTSLSPDMFFLLFPYLQFIGDSLTLVFLKKFILKHASFQQQKIPIPCRLLPQRFLRVNVVFQKKIKSNFPILWKLTPTLTETHTLSHTHTHYYTQLRISLKKRKCVSLFFLFKMADIDMIFSLISVHSLRVLSKWSYVRYTIDQSRDAFFPHFCSKMNLNFNFYLSLLIECACLWICLFCNMISSL